MGTKLSPVGSSQSGGGSIGPTTPTDFTEGSVIFAGASELAENNTAFNWSNSTTQLKLTAGAATRTPLVLKAAAAQSADLFQITDNSDAVQWRVTAAGSGNIFGFNASNGVYSASGEVQLLASGVGLRWNSVTLFTNSPLDLGGSGLGWRHQYFNESAAPAAPAANCAVIYAQDNGAGKTQLMARFPTGAAQQIAIEP